MSLVEPIPVVVVDFNAQQRGGVALGRRAVEQLVASGTPPREGLLILAYAEDVDEGGRAAYLHTVLRLVRRDAGPDGCWVGEFASAVGYEWTAREAFERRFLGGAFDAARVTD